jgi:hypothetical protein
MPLTTYTAGEVLTAASLNDNFTFAASNPSAPAVAIFNETQANNTAGGGYTAGSYVKRTLNTTVVNQITGCTLTSSVIELPAGTYQVSAFAPMFGTNNNKVKLRNTTDSTDTAIGGNVSLGAADNVSANASLFTVFTIAATKDFELQQRGESSLSTIGLGRASNFGDDEVYSTITIVKLA